MLPPPYIAAMPALVPSALGHHPQPRRYGRSAQHSTLTLVHPQWHFMPWCWVCRLIVHCIHQCCIPTLHSARTPLQPHKKCRALSLACCMSTAAVPHFALILGRSSPTLHACGVMHNIPPVSSNHRGLHTCQMPVSGCAANLVNEIGPTGMCTLSRVCFEGRV